MRTVRHSPASSRRTRFRAACHDIIGQQPALKNCAMKQGWRDRRTGRVFGFQSEAQRENFMAARARFCEGPNRQMPPCTAVNKLGEPCRAARMRGRSTCFCHSGNAAQRTRLTAAGLSGDAERIQRAQMRLHRNRLRVLWRRDPRHPGRTLILIAGDEAACRAWAARQSFQLDLLDRDYPAFADAIRWVWARRSRGFISDEELAVKLDRLRRRIVEAGHASHHSR